MQILPRNICISMKKNEKDDTYLKGIKQYLLYFKHQEDYLGEGCIIITLQTILLNSWLLNCLQSLPKQEGINYHIQLKALVPSMHKYKNMVRALDMNVDRGTVESYQPHTQF